MIDGPVKSDVQALGRGDQGRNGGVINLVPGRQGADDHSGGSGVVHCLNLGHHQLHRRRVIDIVTGAGADQDMQWQLGLGRAEAREETMRGRQAAKLERAAHLDPVGALGGRELCAGDVLDGNF